MTSSVKIFNQKCYRHRTVKYNRYSIVCHDIIYYHGFAVLIHDIHNSPWNIYYISGKYQQSRYLTFIHIKYKSKISGLLIFTRYITDIHLYTDIYLIFICYNPDILQIFGRSRGKYQVYIRKFSLNMYPICIDSICVI